MKKVYEDLVENEFFDSEQGIQIGKIQMSKKLHLAMKSIEVYKPNKQNLNPVNLKDSILTYVYI